MVVPAMLVSSDGSASRPRRRRDSVSSDRSASRPRRRRDSVSAERPRRGRGAAATPSPLIDPRRGRGAAATPSPLIDPRRGRGAAATPSPRNAHAAEGTFVRCRGRCATRQACPPRRGLGSCGTRPCPRGTASRSSRATRTRGLRRIRNDGGHRARERGALSRRLDALSRRLDALSRRRDADAGAKPSVDTCLTPLRKRADLRAALARRRAVSDERRSRPKIIGRAPPSPRGRRRHRWRHRVRRERRGLERGQCGAKLPQRRRARDQQRDRDARQRHTRHPGRPVAGCWAL